MALFGGMGGGKVGTGWVPIKPDTKGFGDELERKVSAEGKKAAGLAAPKVQRAFAGAFAAGAAVTAKSIFDFTSFEKGMNEVFTLLPGISGEAMNKMEGQVKDFSVEFGRLPSEVIPALYQSLSAGLPPENVFKFLEIAQKAAKGGVTELATAVDGISSVMNAYGADVMSATQASDLMFTAVRLGDTTFQKLSDSLFQVTPTAAALGVKFGDVTAAIATMAAQGVPTSVATTQLRQAFVELSKDGSKTAKVFQDLSGQTFKQFIASGHNTQDALNLLADHAGKAGLGINDLFGSVEAGSAALALTGKSSEKFGSNLAAMGQSAGATQAAFEQMEKGLGPTIDKLKARFSVDMINLGDTLAPTVKVFGEFFLVLLEGFGALPGPMQAFIVLGITALAGTVALIGPVTQLIATLRLLGAAMWALSLNPWMLAVLALIAVTYLIISNWDLVKSTFISVGEAVWKTTNDVVGLVKAGWHALTTDTVGAFRMVKDTVLREVGEAAGFVTGIPGRVVGAFSNLANIITAPFRAAFNGIRSAWNSTIGGFGFTTPSWIPGMGGKTFSIPSMAQGGILFGPTMFLGGEYAGAHTNPEIVAPRSMIRETVIGALVDFNSQGQGGGGLVVEGPLIGQAVIRRDEDITRLSRELAREIERRQRAGGNRSTVTGAFAS